METIYLNKDTQTDLETVSKILTDSDFNTEIEVEKHFDNSGFNDFSVIILLCKNPVFKNTLKPYDINIYGKKMWKWVELACDGYKVKTTTCSPESNILTLIKPLLENTKFTAVFYSDTPLLQKSTVREIFMFARSRDINVLKLTRGYIFNTEYIKTTETITAIQNRYFEEEDFITAYNPKQLTIISDVIKNRVLDFYMQNGTNFSDINTVYIDCDVVIENGVTIGPNNILRGSSFIGKNTTLDCGNLIENSIICENCYIVNSVIKESRISENAIVGPFEHINKKSL